MRRIRPTTTVGRTLRQVAADLPGELRRLDRRITNTTQALTEAVAASGTTLTQLPGIGDLTAAKILARTGPIRRLTIRSGVRLVLRRGADRGVLRRDPPPPALPRR